MKIILLILYIITLIKTQTCGIDNPKNFDDCNIDSNDKSICCYSKFTLSNSNKSICIFVPKSQIFITQYITAIDIGLDGQYIQIDIDCNIDDMTNTTDEYVPYTPCGEPDPINAYDCLNFSNNKLSCCYIESPDGNKVCLWNDGIYKHNSTYFGMKVICGSYNIKYKLYISLLIVLFLI